MAGGESRSVHLAGPEWRLESSSFVALRECSIGQAEIRPADDADPSRQATREGDEWTLEIKFYGYRSQLIIDEDGIRIFTRNGHDWTSRYGPLIEEAKAIEVNDATIDGEIVVVDEAGLSSFGDLKSAIARRPQDLYFVAFDLLHLHGHDLRRMSLGERRHILADLIPGGGHIQFSHQLEGKGAAIFTAVEQAGMEGIVSKRLSSRYESGRTMEWRKIKSLMESELEVLGVEREAGKPAFALLARPGTRQYVGSAFITVGREMCERLWKRVQEKPGPPPKEMAKRPDTQWTQPGLTARVKHLRGEEMLRHATLLDIREDG